MFIIVDLIEVGGILFESINRNHLTSNTSSFNISKHRKTKILSKESKLLLVTTGLMFDVVNF